MEKQEKIIQTKIAINQIISGALYVDLEMEEIVQLLRDVANDYEKEFNNQLCV